MSVNGERVRRDFLYVVVFVRAFINSELRFSSFLGGRGKVGSHVWLGGWLSEQYLLTVLVLRLETSLL